MPLRERIVRAAKDRAVESLHELTTKATPTKTPAASASASNSTITNTSATAKRNNRSYKPFAEQAYASDNDESDNEAANETPKKGQRQRRRTGTAQKEASHAKGRARNQSTLRNNEINVNEPLTDSTTNSLFNQVYQGQVSLQSIVDDLIELYKKDRDMAMLDLIKFIVRCSGCKAAHMLTNRRDVLRSKEFTEAINELIENFNDDEDQPNNAAAQSEAYPLVQTSVQARRFTRNFSEFLQLLINQCQYSIIYDQFMLDVLITFLIGLADSQVRAFRHTATLAVLKVNFFVCLFSYFSSTQSVTLFQILAIIIANKLSFYEWIFFA